MFDPRSTPDLDAALRALPLEPPPEAACDDGALAVWVAGRLDPRAADAVEAHLAECPTCRDLALALRRSAPSQAALARAEARLVEPGRRWLSAALASAAAVALLALWPAPPPDYTVEGPFGGVQRTRSAPGASAVFRPYGHLRLELAPSRPDRPTHPPLTVYVSRSGGPLRAAPAGAVVAGPGGAYRVQARVDALLGPEPGPWAVHLVLGEAGAGLAGGSVPENAPRGTEWHRVEIELQNEEGEERTW